MSKTPEKLIELFNITSNNYFNITPFDSGEIGFTLQRKYPNTIKYIPRYTKDGFPEKVAIIHVVVFLIDLDEFAETVSEKVPLKISISPFTTNQFSYFSPFDDGNSTEKHLPKSLSICDYAFIDERFNILFDKSHDKINGEEFINWLFDEHCKTSSLFNGLRINKHKAKELKLNYLDWKTLKYENAINVFCGRTLEPKEKLKAMFYGYKSAEMVRIPDRTISFLDQSVSKNSAVTFCITFLSLFFLFWFSGISPSILSILKEYSIVVLFLCFLALEFFDAIVPRILLFFLNKQIKKKNSIIFKK